MQAATPHDSYAALMDLIKARHAQLSPQFQAGARYLADHPDEVAVSSMRSIAARAQVQSAALVRLAQQLGFAGWPELKAIFVERLRAGPSGYAAKAGALTGKEGKERDLVTEVFTVQQRNLAATESANHAALDAAANLLQAAPRVHVAGFRAAHPIAYTLHYLYRLLRPSVQLLSGQGGTLEMDLRALQADEAVVVVSFAPYSSEALLVVQAARQAGCRVVAISDSAMSPLALQADASIVIAVDSPSFFPSIVAGVAAVESLVELLVARAGPDAVTAIGAAEQQLRALGAYAKTSNDAN
ncbi:MurR/RpiR family transcriptional regulator [Janthinobacterium sp. SUN026]|uniref:MurR/RpiR family transcriptional regulator n=1 Tax=Janthinobacterium sp. SUN026 TaxID=3002438 RepID=UPI0025B21C75|nr:MurR/RpiR family transcriptional regulator [Janthinobacterium sp. SUN026]MDN2670707.1 MurR/RpiR family transcriptional regulator [Janthinobacterium sp. SUN026]